MSRFLTLNIPTKTPRWATSSGRVLEPDEGVKDVGWQVDDVPPARWMNWLQNLSYQWTQIPMRAALMNWWPNSVVSGSDIAAALFHPSVGVWTVAHHDSTSTYYSEDGHLWTAGVSLAYNAELGPSAKVNAIDTTRYIIGNSNEDIEYSTDGGQSGAWTTVASATIGGSGRIHTICTKYPDSDFAIVTRGYNPVQVRIAPNGIAGSFIAPTTPPPSPASGADCREMIYVGGSTWIMLTLSAGGAGQTTKLYRSNDDGDTWTHVTGLSFPSSSSGAFDIAYNRDSGRLIVVGDKSPTIKGYISYSDDLGDTWTDVVPDRKGLDDWDLGEVYYAGGGCWIATGSFINYAYRGPFISTDNGESWQIADTHGIVGPTGFGVAAIACDERKVMMFGSNGVNAYCLAT